MLKTLIKINLSGYFIGLASKSTKSGKRTAATAKSIGGAALLMAVIVLSFGFMFYTVFSAMAHPFADVGLGWLYFIYVGIVAFALQCIFSIFAAQKQLFEAKDNNRLLSMPIKPSAILGARMVSLLVINLFWEILVVAPAVIAYLPNSFNILGVLVFTLTLPFFSLAVSSLFGWLLAVITSRLRRKTLFETVLSMAFLIAYLIVYSQMNTIIQNLVLNSAASAEEFGAIAPLYLVGYAAVNGGLGVLWTFLMFTVPFAFVYFVLSRTFISIATAKRGAAKLSYTGNSADAMPVKKALAMREARLFTSSSVYIMNAGLGAFFLTAGAAALLIFRGSIKELIAGTFVGPLSAFLVPGFILIILFCGGMALPSSSAVSVEGKALWIIRSMPISSEDILLSKLGLTLKLFVLPLTVCYVCGISAIAPVSAGSALSLLACLAAFIFMAESNLIINLKHPLLDWESMTQPVKQSSAVLIAMLANLIINLVCAGGTFGLCSLGLSDTAAFGIVAAVFAALDFAAFRWITGKGCAVFENL